MSFGRNPHVMKAQAAEQKARDARDELARSRAWYDAAHQWDRAAQRELPGARRIEYEANAARARERAGSDGLVLEGDAAPIDKSLLN